MIRWYMYAQIPNLEQAIITYFWKNAKAQNRLRILTHYLKGLSLSFQKILKLTLLDQRN